LVFHLARYCFKLRVARTISVGSLNERSSWNE